MKKTSIKNLTVSALCLALSVTLPLLIGQVPQIGKALCPMHIPVLLCGFLCPWGYGLAVGLIAPFLRNLIFGLPELFPTGIVLAVEMGVYGIVIGTLSRRLPKKIGYYYVSLICAMILGRLASGLCSLLLLTLGLLGEYSLAIFFSAVVLKTIPAMLLQLLVVPILVHTLNRRKDL